MPNRERVFKAADTEYKPVIKALDNEPRSESKR